MATRHLWTRQAETVEGNRVLNEARDLARKYPNLSDGELIRLAYWGVSGTPPVQSDAKSAPAGQNQ